MLKRIRHLHFVGVGGAGMSGIAELLLNQGYAVSGSDLKASEATERLRAKGAQLFVGHRAEQVRGAHVVVYSSAVQADNPELAEARRMGIPVIPRAEMLAELMRMKYGVAVAGTHGKTTTTSLVGLVLTYGGLDPTLVIGGRLKTLGGGAKLGKGEFLVAEADESDGSFLWLTPTFAVITNIDNDHLDYHGSMDALTEAFTRFASRVPFYGCVVLCADDPRALALKPRLTRRVVTYGTGPEAQVRATRIDMGPEGSRFSVEVGSEPLGDFRVRALGRHNVLNALAAVAMGVELELPPAKIAAALASFPGTARRLETLGEPGGILVVDDYGHHPTEIRATLAAAALLSRRIHLVFQPHRYTRTQLLVSEFGKAFHGAARVALLNIYPAGERPIPGVSTELVRDAVAHAGGPPTDWLKDREEVPAWVRREARPGDVVLVMGAGDVRKVGEALVTALLPVRGGSVSHV